MDIYFGSSLKITENHKSKFQRFTFLDDHIPVTPSDRLFVLKKPAGESTYVDNESFEVLFDGYIPGKGGEELEKSIAYLAKAIASKSKIDYINYSGLWNICIREKLSGNIWLTSDPSAVLPLHYSIMGKDLFYCSHMHILGSVLNSGPDNAGLSQKIALGYTLGPRTLYDGIMRLNPGETIFYEKTSGRLVSTYQDVYYTSYRKDKDAGKLIFNSLSESFKKMRDQYDTMGLMLSEGFDSRFLGGLAQREGFKIKSYTHITPGAGGVAIVEKVTAMLGSRHHFQSVIDGYYHDRDEIEKQLYLADNLNYPFWMQAADYFRKISDGFPVIIGSSLDCTLGGNIFARPSKNVWPAVNQRYTEILRQNFGLMTEKYTEDLSAELLKGLMIKTANCHAGLINGTLNSGISGNLVDESGSLNDHIEAELNRIKSSGSATPSMQLQRFVLENRDRKLFFGQPLTIRKYNKIYIPSFEYNFMDVVSSISPGGLLHHKFYIEILRRFLPGHLLIYNGTYGLPPWLPRYILETSRFIQKRGEKKLYKELLMKKGNTDHSKFRTATIFELCGRSLRDQDLFRSHVSRNKNVFNVEEMDRFFDDASNYKIRVFNFEGLYRGLEICQALNKSI